MKKNTLYIRIFVRIFSLIRIYSDIRSYRFLDINIFKYSFKNLYSSHPGLETFENLINLI